MRKDNYSIKLTKESVENILVDKCSWIKETDFGVLVFYRSPCKRYVLQETEYSNLCDPITGKGWNLHIDNSDMCSIASCDVEYIGQISELMKIYNRY